MSDWRRAVPGIVLMSACFIAAGCATANFSPPPEALERSVPSFEGDWSTFCLVPGVRIFKRAQAYGKAYTALDVSGRTAPDPWACP